MNASTPRVRLAAICLVFSASAISGCGTEGDEPIPDPVEVDGLIGYRVDFDNVAGLVSGNEVLIEGRPAGRVGDIRLRSNWRVLVKIAVDRPLNNRSTVAVGGDPTGIANRHVSITPGPEDSPLLPENATIEGVSTPIKGVEGG